MSVTSYVDANGPPVLIFHGDQDPFVFLDHAVKLKEKLDSANVACELVIVKGAHTRIAQHLAVYLKQDHTSTRKG